MTVDGVGAFVDNHVKMNATAQFTDGTSFSGSLEVIQLIVGRLFIVPPTSTSSTDYAFLLPQMADFLSH